MTRIIRELSYAYGRRNRRRKARFARRFIAEHGITSLLVVGASRMHNEVDGIVERSLLDTCPKVVISGYERGLAEWPGYVQADGLDLPFGRAAFDLVYSNAVIEHVGGEEEQRRFLAEHDRVGRHWITTTPNRWFPVEAHRHQLFRHWSPSWEDPHGSVTRLLTPSDLRELLPRGRVVGTVMSPTLTAVSS